jgi:AcrR family transcriptional regulator
MNPQNLRARIKETVSGAILDAAEQVAAEVGLPAASLQAIATRAGVSVGTIYNHFADRNELFEEVFARRRGELLATLDGVAAATMATATGKRTAATTAAAAASFETLLASFVRTVLVFFDSRRAFLRIALEGGVAKAAVSRSGRAASGSSGASSGASSMEQLQARAERIVRAGLGEGLLRSDGAELLGPFLIAAVRAAIIARIDSTLPLGDETDRVIGLFMRGAAAS